MSTVSDVSSSSVSQLYQQQRRPHGPGKEIREGIGQLKKALESGDLSAAQKAYDSLSELNSKRQAAADGTSGSTSSTGKDPLSNMLSEVGTALKTGDISKVQQAFAQFGPPQGGPGGAQGHGGHRHHRHAEGEGASDEVKQAMGQLGQSLSSGDLSGAQSAYQALSSMFGGDSGNTSTGGSSSSSSTSSTSATSSTSKASSAADRFKELMGDLGSALQTGHLASAQSLFAALTPRGSQGIDIMA